MQDFPGLKRVVTDKHFYFNATKGFPCLKKAQGQRPAALPGQVQGPATPSRAQAVVQRLRAFYRPFNRKFYQMTGQDFPGWD